VKPLLSLEGVETAYGSSQVLFGVRLEVGEGEAVGLLGRNGMGKTTTIRSILGLTPARAGTITYAGERIERRSPDRIARGGIGLVPEGRRIFPNLSVRENLLAFARPGPDGRSAWTLDRVLGLFPGLAARMDHAGNALSGGEQQMLAIGRALMTNPRLLILDEATEGLAPRVRAEIWRVLGELRDAGQTLLVVDKYLRDLLALADRHVVLERGRVAWEGSSAQLAAQPALWQRYLGV